MPPFYFGTVYNHPDRPDRQFLSTRQLTKKLLHVHACNICVTTSRVTIYYNNEKIQDCTRSLANDKGAQSVHMLQRPLEWSYIPGCLECSYVATAPRVVIYLRGPQSGHTLRGFLDWLYIPKAPRIVTCCKGPGVVKRLQINICSFVLSPRLVCVFHLILFLQLTKHNFGIYEFFIRSSV